MDKTLRQSLAKAMTKATAPWRETMRQADRDNRPRGYGRMYVYSDRVTIKKVANEVMEEAYNKASSNGMYFANARQIFYAARPLILAKATSDTVDSVYFTQTLLKDYIEENTPDWAGRVVWDARGHFREPYSEHPIGVGGAEVLEYTNGWRDPDAEFSTPVVPKGVGTQGPKGRYHGVLFIEKEGFDELLESQRFAERYDIAVMSTKGVPVGAACDLLGALYDVPVYVAHDLDKSGFTIIETLRRGTRLSHGREVIDLGLRLADCDGLESEPAREKWNKNEGGARFLQKRGATAAEVDLIYRKDRRIELNAMTSEQFITWLDAALVKAGAKKYVPDTALLKEAYIAAIKGKRFEAMVEEWEEEQKIEGAVIKAPTGLKKRVQEALAAHPGRSWDSVLWDMAENDEDEA